MFSLLSLFCLLGSCLPPLPRALGGGGGDIALFSLLSLRPCTHRGAIHLVLLTLPSTRHTTPQQQPTGNLGPNLPADAHLLLLHVGAPLHHLQGT